MHKRSSLLVWKVNTKKKKNTSVSLYVYQCDHSHGRTHKKSGHLRVYLKKLLSNFRENMHANTQLIH